MIHDDDERYSTSTSFLLWLACVFGLCGIHRFYLGKPLTGLLYLFTFGLAGIGQLVDLIKMKDMVLLANAKERERLGVAQGAPARPRQLPAAAQVDPLELMRIKLLEAARRHGGVLTVSQGVMATGKTFEEVEKALDAMAQSGFVGIDNHPETGAVIYTFGELA